MRAKLAFQAQRRLLEVLVSNLMPIRVVHLLEVVEVDVDQSENGCIETRLIYLGIQQLFQGEAVVDIGEQVELRAVQQVGVEAACLDGQGGKACCPGQSFSLRGGGHGEQVECRREEAERRAEGSEEETAE